MPLRLNYIRRFIPLLAVVLGAAAALPQSHHREAMKWFDAGLAEKSAAKRIAAYTQAVEINPNFAEALFNLGAAHKEQKNYDRAEEYFRRAANSAQNNLRVKALSELASTYNIRGNSKSSESALREARTLVDDPKQRAVLSYELGRFLYQQGRYEQAVAELKEGRAGDPAQRETFDNLLKLAENSLQLDDLFATAEKQKAGGNLKEAKATLEQIKAKNANFREVQTRLAEIEALLIADAGKTAIAVAPVPGNANAEEAEKAHDEGVAAMNRNDLDSALVAPGKAQKINRKYRDVARLNAQVEAARQRHPDPVIQSPPANVTEANAPDTSFTATLPPMTNSFAVSSNSARSFAGNASLDSLYQIARAAFARGDWNDAMLGFQKVRMRQADYREVDQLFAAARTKLLERSAAAEAAEAINLSQPSPLVIGGFIVAVLGFFAVGFVFFLPRARARYQSWRGNHEAALIYESLLARGPSRLKLYSALAEIYLKLDRRDEAAMKIYRQVLELNLPSPRRAELEAIVALDRADEKPANGEATAANATTMPETNGVLLADGGFHQPQEKTSARRPRKKKEAPANRGDENGAVIDHAALNGEAPVNGELHAPNPAPAKKTRRKKITVVDTVSANGTMTNPAVVAPEADLRADSVAPDEIVFPAESELVAQH